MQISFKLNCEIAYNYSILSFSFSIWYLCAKIILLVLKIIIVNELKVEKSPKWQISL